MKEPLYGPNAELIAYYKAPLNQPPNGFILTRTGRDRFGDIVAYYVNCLATT